MRSDEAEHRAADPPDLDPPTEGGLGTAELRPGKNRSGSPGDPVQRRSAPVGSERFRAAEPSAVVLSEAQLLPQVSSFRPAASESVRRLDSRR